MRKYITIALAMMVIAMTAVVSLAQELSIEGLPASVIKTAPVCGDTAVPSVTSEIRITFSKGMMDKSWSFTQLSPETFPEIVGEPRYLADGRTCVITVKLKPNKTYIIWLNSKINLNFRDTTSKPAVPYLLVFKTK